ncbi:S-adenosylmethionine:tRNA ribosyltransferase-isomerase [Spirochaetia bacterium]|nr:S-adenosylmethionine:tRNA ribosyltransferase-isomerase [Spirochaetia bacterium]
MKKSDFYFDLPPELIAQHPCIERGASRLLTLNRKTGERTHGFVKDIISILQSGSVIVFNNTRVRKARIYGTDVKSGACVEFLLLKKCENISLCDEWTVMLKKARKYKQNSVFQFADGTEAALDKTCNSKALGETKLIFNKALGEEWFEKWGHVPLPPYIKRPAGDSKEDAARYQTIYAGETGSVAAPTAGLHWTDEMLGEIKKKGIEAVFITLHVGAGTFLPVRSENIEDHVMHEECYTIEDEAASAIEKAKQTGRPVIAVGTTTMRTLESAWQNNHLRRGDGCTSIFIYGDYHFNVADALFTNFHTPESTLLMLVSSFAGANSSSGQGRTLIIAAYREAMEQGYKFFSYGDAMFIY